LYADLTIQYILFVVQQVSLEGRTKIIDDLRPRLDFGLFNMTDKNRSQVCLDLVQRSTTDLIP